MAEMEVLKIPVHQRECSVLAVSGSAKCASASHLAWKHLLSIGRLMLKQKLSVQKLHFRTEDIKVHQELFHMQQSYKKIQDFG